MIILVFHPRAKEGCKGNVQLAFRFLFFEPEFRHADVMQFSCIALLTAKQLFSAEKKKSYEWDDR